MKKILNVRKFRSLDLVLEFLHKRGFIISRTTLYRHKKAGKLIPHSDGTFLESAVLGYADAFLARAESSDVDSVDVMRVQEQKLVSDARRAKALAKLAESKAQEADGAYILREEFHRKLALRALYLKSDLQNFVYQLVPELCAVLEGEQDHIPEGIQLAQDRLDVFLGRYAAQEEKNGK